MAIEDNSQYNTHTETGVCYDQKIPKKETEEGKESRQSSEVN